jgi:molybdopterin converting factor small subunit
VQGRHGSFNGVERLTAIRLQIGHGMQQAARVRMSRGVKDFLFGTQLDDASGIHHGYAVGDLRDHRQIVGDEKHGKAELGTEVGEQSENLGLNRDIEGGGGLVRDEQLWVVHNRHGNHDALAHASGELVRIVAGATAGIRDGDVVHRVHGPLPRSLRRYGVVRQESLRDLVANAHDGIESGHGLLKDHGDARAAELPHGAVRKRGEVAGRAVFGEQDVAGDAGLRRKQPHDGEGGDRFSGAGFADQPKDFAGSDGEAEVAHRCQGPCRGSRSRLCSGKLYVQVANVEKREHGVMLAVFDKTFAPPATQSRGRLFPHGLLAMIAIYIGAESSQSAAASFMLRPMSKIHIPTPLRQYVGKQSTVEVTGTTVGEAMSDLLVQHPDLRRHLYADDGRLRAFVNLYVNDEDIRYLQKEATAVKEGDNISIVPSIAGGA